MVVTTLTIAHMNCDNGNFVEDLANFGKWPW